MNLTNDLGGFFMPTVARDNLDNNDVRWLVKWNVSIGPLVYQSERKQKSFQRLCSVLVPSGSEMYTDESHWVIFAAWRLET